MRSPPRRDSGPRHTQHRGALNQLPLDRSRLRTKPPFQYAPKCPQEEMARAAGRIDKSHVAEANSAIAGSRVRSRMNSSTNSGVCSRA